MLVTLGNVRFFEAPYLPTDLLYLLISEALRLVQKRSVTCETSKSFGWSFDAAAAMTTPRTSSGWSTAVTRASDPVAERVADDDRLPVLGILDGQGDIISEIMQRDPLLKSGAFPRAARLKSQNAKTRHRRPATRRADIEA